MHGCKVKDEEMKELCGEIELSWMQGVWVNVDVLITHYYVFNSLLNNNSQA